MLHVLKIGEKLESKDFGLDNSDLAVSIENVDNNILEIKVAKKTQTLPGTKTNFYLQTKIKLLNV